MIVNQDFRVAIILSELRPGGMERVVVHLAKGLASRGNAIMVICLENPGVLVAEFDGTEVLFKALRSLSGYDIRAFWHLRKLLIAFRPNVINVHDYASIPYVVAANCFAFRSPIIFTAHGLLYEGFEGLRRRYRFFSRFFSKLSAVSKAVAERHKAYLNWTGHTSVIQNGVPAISREDHLRKAVRAEFGIGQEDSFFLAVGNPRPEKGFEDLIDAAVTLRDREGCSQKFMIAVAGTLTASDYCRMLSRRVEEYGVQDYCRFLGFRNDMAALYSAADAFVLSSRSEGLPMVILESMIAGLPVVATRVGGVPDVIENRGLLVDPGQPDQLANAMARLINEEGLAESLAKEGQAHVHATYGVDRMVEDYIACYQATLSQKGCN